MDIVAILDTETTGLDKEKDDCIEVAIVEYSLSQKSIIGCLSLIIESNKGNPQTEKLNHIPLGLLSPSYGRKPELVWPLVDRFARRAEAILAHNADFDKQWVPESSKLHELPWVDTCFGVVWPRQSSESGSLINLAFEHGLGIDSAHRALADCLLLARLLSRCAELGYDLDEILARGLRPQGLFRALVPYEQRKLAKNAGFKWQAETKTWERKMAVDDVADLGFRVKRVR